MIRGLLGDTDPTCADLQDEEIGIYVTLAGAVTTKMGTVFRAAYLAATALMGRYAYQVTYGVKGDINFSASDRYSHYQGVAGSMQALMASAPATLYAGGTSIIDKIGQDNDQDRVKPVFTRHTGSMPGTMNNEDPDDYLNGYEGA